MAEAANISFDDAVLVRQCRRGDSTAMQRLLLKYQSRIYNVIFRMCQNVDDAAELTQDTFVKIIENIANFKGQSSFYTWAFRIAVNLTLNYRSRAARFSRSSLDAADEADLQAKDALKQFLCDESSPDPAVVAENKELCELIVKALIMLDDQQRAVVVLRDIEGMNYAQIAEVLDTELGTVKSRLSRARSNLREIMESISQ